MRSIKELLQVMIDNSDELGIQCGICFMNTSAYVYKITNRAEWILLSDFLSANLPKQKYQHNGLAFAFPYGEIQPRLDWLNEQIAKLET